MPLSPLAGKPAPSELLIDVAKLRAAYTSRAPDVDDPAQLVSFGTSGHRGAPEDGAFNEAHILAITQAICEHRARAGITGPLFLGVDTHAASAPAQQTALEVLAANDVETLLAPDDAETGGAGFTPTPALSRAVLAHNRGRREGDRLADGIVITPSHNPPRDGGFKYNPPSGGPADLGATRWIEATANNLKNHLLKHLEELIQMPAADRLKARYEKYRAFGHFEEKVEASNNGVVPQAGPAV